LQDDWDITPSLRIAGQRFAGSIRGISAGGSGRQKTKSTTFLQDDWDITPSLRIAAQLSAGSIRRISAGGRGRLKK
jgi:hypothetical protein